MVDPVTGVVTPAKNGTTSIRLTANGLTASASIRVVPNLQGNWSGTIAWHGCDNVTGEARVWLCSHSTTGNIVMSLMQNGANVQGTLSPGYAVTGSIDASGVLTLESSTVWQDPNSASRMVSWTSLLTGTQLTGDFTIHTDATDGSIDSADNHWALSNVVGSH